MATNAADYAQLRQCILSIVNAEPPVGVNRHNANAYAASTIASIHHIPPDLHKILARAGLNLNEPAMFKLSSAEGRKKKPPVKPNANVAAAIARYSTSKVSADAVMEPDAKTELDSHANMLVVGRHAYIMNSSGRTAQVSRTSLSS